MSYDPEYPSEAFDTPGIGYCEPDSPAYFAWLADVVCQPALTHDELLEMRGF